MPQPLSLEDFGSQSVLTAGGAGPASPAERALEAERLAAYDKGYGAGWEDAVRAASQDRDRIGQELADNLRDLSFTYHEARAHVMRGLAPLLTGVMEQVLPAAMRASFGQRLAEEIAELAEGPCDLPVHIVLAQGEAARVEPLLPETPGLPLELTEDTALVPGQAHLRLGRTEREIDLSGLLDTVAAGLAALDQTNEELLRHG
ncbi:MAG: ABC transporter ATP-binding protein [Tranquillimonas sp.]|jgi:flagellar assembly protein FliH